MLSERVINLSEINESIVERIFDITRIEGWNYVFYNPKTQKINFFDKDYLDQPTIQRLNNLGWYMVDSGYRETGFFYMFNK